MFLFLALIGCSRSQPDSEPAAEGIKQVEEENLDVFHQWIRWNNPGSFLIDHMNQQAFQYYDIRDREIAQLRNGDDWKHRQQQVREKLVELVGPFPERAPLNPQVAEVLQKDGYRIEKLVYESMPDFYVTGCLFIPDHLNTRAPAVLNLIGHEQESFRAELDQIIILNLVRKGIIVLAIDPLGQGEHVQYFDPQIGLSSIGYSVVEHCYFGNQCFLSGVSSARYFIWDAIRAIDYLMTRDEVDTQRIGVTGFSGGGTITSYVGALDDRVAVAVPSSWSTASRRQLETKGAQDAETEFLYGLISGITFEDLIEARAPRPTLLTFTSRDEYLSLQGAREAYLEAKEAFQALDQPGNLQLVEDDYRHWLTPKIRQAIYGFFMKHFNMPGDSLEQEVEFLSKEELQVTATGQISTSLGGKMVFDVHKEDTEVLMNHLVNARKQIDEHLRIVPLKAKKISGYIPPADQSEDVFINGRYQREGGYAVTKYALPGEGDYVIPILLFVPTEDTGKHAALIYLHSGGKSAGSAPGGEIETLVKSGFIVAAVDLLGVGETRNTASRALAPGYTGVLIGRSLVGIQAADVVRLANYLKTRADVDCGKIGAVAFDAMCLPLIHAAAFDPSITRLALIRPLVSYRSVAMNRMYKMGLIPNEGGGTWHPYEVDFSWGIAGVLTGYDLPDLIGSIAPRKVIIVQPQDQMLELASEALLEQEMEFPRAAYAHLNASNNLKITSSYPNLASIIEWCFGRVSEN